jgi:uncharacterized protein
MHGQEAAWETDYVTSGLAGLAILQASDTQAITARLASAGPRRRDRDARPGSHAPKINDGVKVNIRPFQENGLPAVKQVIKKVVDGERRLGSPPERADPWVGVAEQEVLDAIVSGLVDELHPERIYLFGSRARGDATRDSDYDVLVVVKERIGPPFEMERRSRRALRDVRRPMDIVIVTRDYFDWMLGAAASLPSTVRREGCLLYGG